MFYEKINLYVLLTVIIMYESCFYNQLYASIPLHLSSDSKSSSNHSTSVADVVKKNKNIALGVLAALGITGLGLGVRILSTRIGLQELKNNPEKLNIVLRQYQNALKVCERIETNTKSDSTIALLQEVIDDVGAIQNDLKNNRFKEAKEKIVTFNKNATKGDVEFGGQIIFFLENDLPKLLDQIKWGRVNDETLKKMAQEVAAQQNLVSLEGDKGLQIKANELCNKSMKLILSPEYEQWVKAKYSKDDDDEGQAGKKGRRSRRVERDNAPKAFDMSQSIEKS